MIKKICVVIGSRANYASIKSFMKLTSNDPRFELQIIANCSAVSEKYGNVAALIEREGFKISKKLYSLIEDGDNITMVRTTGLSMMDLASAFDELLPNFVITIGDRYETMATAVAASYMNIPLVHTMGGEVTGTIDESIRHAITKLAHIHFVANEDAKNRVLKLGEDPETVFNVGCPRIDEVKQILEAKAYDLTSVNLDGVGDIIDMKKEFILLSYHPVTTEVSEAAHNMRNVLQAIDTFGMQIIALWPNADAGTNSVSQELRFFQKEKTSPIRFIKNLPMNQYIGLMANTECLVGNSSSGIREGAYIGTKVINIGTRQQRRVRGQNCIDVGYEKSKIVSGINTILGRTTLSEAIYGDGNTARQMVEVLANIKVNCQKIITY